MGWNSCVPCCGNSKGMEENWEDILTEEEVEEIDEQYVFLEQFPTDRRVLKPSVPFINELPVPMDVGKIIELQGKVLPHATRFSLNLICGTTSTVDIAFHLNPRFDQNYVARNSRLSGHWGKEESTSYNGNPFKRDQKFCFAILAAENEFMVAVNGYHFCSYTYRTPRIRIQAVQINGDVIVDSFYYHMALKFPEAFPNMTDPVLNISPDCPLSESLQEDTVRLPLVCRFEEAFHVGSQLEIVGRTKLLPYSFYVNLQDNVYTWPHPEIYFHLNPRFWIGAKYGIVMNSWVQGGWAVEEAGPLLFRPGRPFLLKICLTENAFKITVDGAEIGSYHFRNSLHPIKALYIQGDVCIKEITVR